MPERPNGDACSNIMDPTLVKNDKSYAYLRTPLGGATTSCASGWCLGGNVLQGQPVCGTIGQHGSGCDDTGDCYKGGSVQMECINKQCKIPNGVPCSGIGTDDSTYSSSDIQWLPYANEQTLLGGATPACASGWCLSGYVAQQEPVCGTIGQPGSGCDDTWDCYSSGSVQMECINSQCTLSE